ncbi:MAG TPA: tripartite tricarboxylate transporter substrate binding protein [Alphaproteobacteria bacterium]
MSRRSWIFAVFLLAGAGLTSWSASAADAWPSRPVRIVVPFSAGGSADILGRIAAQQLTEALGQQFVADNRPGAGGLIGVDIAVHAPPDGYTLAVSGIASLVVGPVLNPNAPFDPIKDLTHIALLGGPPSVLVVHKDVPVKTVAEFISLAKSTPGGLSYGTPGIGTHGHLVGEMFQQRAGFHMAHVPYRGASQAVTDIVAGQVPVGSVTLTTASEQILSGAIRALAVTSTRRLAEYADVPTFVELGYPDMIATTWFSLSGPVGLPPDIVNRINAVVTKSWQKPEVRKRLDRDAIDPEPYTPAEFTEFVKAEIARWAPLARASGAKPE